MIKNNKGFTLIELTVVVLILSVLAGIAIPQYMTSTRKAQIASQLIIMKALQADIINFYNLNNTLPSSLFNLSLNRTEFRNINASGTQATHNANNCTFSLTNSGKEVVVDCNRGWNISYSVIKRGVGYMPNNRVFNITNGEDRLRKVARSLGWQEINSNSFNIR